MSTTIRRVGVSLAAAAALLLSSVGVATAEPTTDDPAEAAAGWLVTQLTADDDGAYYEGAWGVDLGVTLDILFALAGTGVGGDAIDDIARYLDRPATVSAYTGLEFDDVWAGQTAKLIIGADVVDRPADDLGGVDLIAQLESLQSEEDGEEGWYRNADVDNDFSSTLSQALAVTALARVEAHDTLDDGVDFLLSLQCDDGGFRASPGEGTCAGEVDTTAIAADALYTVDQDDAADHAVAWLATQQNGDGAFQGSDDLSTNSTGVAAVAFHLAGQDHAQRVQDARQWILGLQHGCADHSPGAIAAGPADEGDLARATPQALAGLVGASLGQVTSAGAQPDAPPLACDEPAERDVRIVCDATDGVVHGGDTIDCSVEGLDAGEVVRVLVSLNPTLLDDEVAADAEGVAAFTFDVPEDAAEGDAISIEVSGEDADVLAELSLAVAASQVDDEDAPEPIEAQPEPTVAGEPLEGTQAEEGELPRTGMDTVGVAGLAALLLAGGALLLAGTRRRTVDPA